MKIIVEGGERHLRQVVLQRIERALSRTVGGNRNATSSLGKTVTLTSDHETTITIHNPSELYHSWEPRR